MNFQFFHLRRISRRETIFKPSLPRSVFLTFLRSKNKAKPWQKSTAGFTLIELLVAATLVMIVFGAILALVNYSIYATTFIQNNLIASFLAQEGVELTIKKRSENWVLGRDFNFGLGSGDYRIDYLDNFDANFSEPLKFDDVRGYQYAYGQPTNFVRKITVESISQSHLRVTSEVAWKSRTKAFSIVVEDHLFDWFGVEPE